MHAGVAERAMAIVTETHSFTPKGVRGIVSAPAAHATQSVSASLPVDARCLPAAQSTHAVAPATLEYLPVAQERQSVSDIACSEHTAASMRQEPVARRPQCLLHEMDGHVGADAGVSEMAAQRVSGMTCIEKRTGVL